MEQILTVINERKRVMPRVSKAKCDIIELTHAGEELRRDTLGSQFVEVFVFWATE